MESLVEPESTNETASIDPIGLLLRHKFKSLVVFALVTLASIVFTAMSEPTFESQAQLFVQLGRESVTLDPTATTGQFVSLGDTRETEMNSLFELIKSDEVLMAVVEEVTPEEILGKGTFRIALSNIKPLNNLNLNPFRIYSLEERAAMKLAKKLKVRTTKNSNVIDISYQSHDNETAKSVLEALIKHTTAKHMEVHRVEGSNQFFSDQALMHKNKLAALDDDIQVFKTENGLASLQDQRTIQLTQIGNLEQESARLLSQKLALEDEIERRQQELKNLPKTLETEVVSNVPKTAGDEMLSEVYKLQLEEKRLLASFREEHPRVQQIRDQLAQARKAVSREQPKPQITRANNEWRERSAHELRDRQAQFVSLTSQYSTVKADLAAARTHIKKLNEQELALRRMERERDILEVTYKKYQENLEQTRIDRELQERRISNITIAQQPTLNQTPASPNVMLNLAVGSILAMIGGAGTAVWGENRLAKRQREASRQLALAQRAHHREQMETRRAQESLVVTKTNLPTAGDEVTVRLPAEPPVRAAIASAGSVSSSAFLASSDSHENRSFLPS